MLLEALAQDAATASCTSGIDRKVCAAPFLRRICHGSGILGCLAFSVFGILDWLARGRFDDLRCRVGWFQA